MPSRKQVTQDEFVAQRMRRVFSSITGLRRPWLHRLTPDKVAHIYGILMWDSIRGTVKDSAKLSRFRFHVSLSTTLGDHREFEFLTKRASLVSDTLLLSHDWTGQFHRLSDESAKVGTDNSLLRNLALSTVKRFVTGAAAAADSTFLPGSRVLHFLDRKGMNYGMHCPDLHELGRWLLDAEPLLKAGLAWYLPSYSTQDYHNTWLNGRVETEHPEQVRAVDYLIRDGRAIEASGTDPNKSQLVRPVLRIDLPFLDAVDLRHFSKITVEEFGSYSAFRDFLRLNLLEMDDAMNDVQSERELLKLGIQIKDQIRATRAEMLKVRRKKAVSVTGAVVGSVGAVLVAVYGPALAAAVAAVGASAGGLWGIVNAAAENSTRALREDKWYYVWALSRKSNSPLRAAADFARTRSGHTSTNWTATRLHADHRRRHHRVRQPQRDRLPTSSPTSPASPPPPSTARPRCSTARSSSTTTPARSTSDSCSNAAAATRPTAAHPAETSPFDDVPVRFLAFDLLQLGETSLLREPYEQRRRELTGLAMPDPYRISVVRGLHLHRTGRRPPHTPGPARRRRRHRP